jgi:hypothetical protein
VLPVDAMHLTRHELDEVPAARRADIDLELGGHQQLAPDAAAQEPLLRTRSAMPALAPISLETYLFSPVADVAITG